MKYDILKTNEESLSVEVVAGHVNSSRSKNITKKGVRLFENNKIYTTSYVGDISDADLLKKAQGNKSVGIPYDYELPKYKSMSVIDHESLKDPLSKIMETIEQTQDRLRAYSNEFVFSGKFNRDIATVTITDDQGTTLEKKFASNDWYYLFKKVGSPNLMDGYFECSTRLLSPESVNDTLDRNLPYLAAYNNEIKFQNGKYPVLFLEGGLYGKLAESLRADSYCEGSALYSGKMGKQLFSKDFSLYDVNYAPEFSVYRQFDEEGTIRSIAKLPLIENGVIKHVISDLRNAKKYGVEATGNGQRSFDSAVGLGFNRLVMGHGKRSTQEILKSLDNCIVVFMGHGGDFTDKGDYSTPLQLSYLVQKGEIIGRLPQLTVKTTTEDAFNHRMIEVASDGFQKNHMKPSFFSEMDVYVN